MVFLPDLGAPTPERRPARPGSTPAGGSAPRWFDAGARGVRPHRLAGGGARRGERGPPRPSRAGCSTSRSPGRATSWSSPARGGRSGRLAHLPAGAAWSRRRSAASAALARRIPLAEAATAGARPAARRPPAPAAGPPRRRRRRRASPAPPPPRPIRLPVTELAEYARCPRRHLPGRVLGLPEPPGYAAAPPTTIRRAPPRAARWPTPCSPRLELAAPPLERRAQLAAVAARRGYDPADPGWGGSSARCSASWPRRRARAGRGGRGRGGSGARCRSCCGSTGTGRPAACYLVGAIDALVTPRPEGRLTGGRLQVRRPARRGGRPLPAPAPAPTRWPPARAHPGRPRARPGSSSCAATSARSTSRPTPEELARLRPRCAGPGRRCSPRRRGPDAGRARARRGALPRARAAARGALLPRRGRCRGSDARRASALARHRWSPGRCPLDSCRRPAGRCPPRRPPSSAGARTMADDRAREADPLLVRLRQPGDARQPPPAAHARPPRRHRQDGDPPGRPGLRARPGPLLRAEPGGLRPRVPLPARHRRRAATPTRRRSASSRRGRRSSPARSRSSSRSTTPTRSPRSAARPARRSPPR